jgi:hypothetical protein
MSEIFRPTSVCPMLFAPFDSADRLDRAGRRIAPWRQTLQTPGPNR